MPVLFAVTLFVSASLLFMIQPMVGRMVLPLLGGSPAAWNTCMVFFQMVLLLGYLYAHKLTGKLSPAQQVVTHVVVLLVAVGTFALAAMAGPDGSPIAVIRSLAPQNSSYPMFGVLALLAVAIGVPFFAVSTSAPLLQRWFAYTGHPASRDPYFLYAASNAGSLLSLLAYPLVTEPLLTLNQQAWVFAVGFVALGLLIAVAGSLVGKPAEPTKAEQVQADAAPKEPEPTWPRKLRWTALAFVPSSLMLGVTFHMTTDIASIPLLWVGPLALYLLTFIIAFAHTPKWFRPVLGNVSPVVTLLLVFVLTSQTSINSTFLSLGLHLVAYFLAALLCHSELARDRPAAEHLTNYYLWISVGGMLGGLFNALFAPVVFPLAYEYPIAIAVGCMLIPKLDDTKEEEDTALGRILDLLIPLAMVAAVGGLTLLNRLEWYGDACRWVARQMTTAFQFARVPVALERSNVDLLVAYAVPAMVCFFFIDRPIRFGLCVAAILFVGNWRQNESLVRHTERSFFGILKVEELGKDGEFRRLVHGTTLHGTQIRAEQGVVPVLELPTVEPWDDGAGKAQIVAAAANPWAALALAGVWERYDYKQEPLTYYHRNGPVGLMFRHLFGRNPGAPFAMVGLGTGSVSCYAGRGQTLTFYEIDPTVKKLVADQDKWFSYVKDAERRGANVEFVLGDARLKLEEQTDRKYPLLLVDAFSSDSIPVHLLTKQAVELYMDRLTPDGVLALHISNKYVALEYVVDRIATELGLVARVMSDNKEKAPGKTASSWVVLGRTAEHLGPLAGPYPDQAEAYLPRSRPLVALVRTHGDTATVGDVVKKELGDAADLLDLVRLLDQSDDSIGVERLVKLVTESVEKERKEAEGKRAAVSASPPELRAKLLDEAKALDESAAKEAVAVKHVELLAKRYAADTPFKTAVKMEYGWRNPALVDALVDYGSSAAIGGVLRDRYGPLFGPLKSSDVVRLWTDDYSDVLSVMMIPEVQRLRAWLGQPTLEELRK